MTQGHVGERREKNFTWTAARGPLSITKKYFIKRMCFLVNRIKFYINDIYWKHKKVSKGI